MKAGQNLGMFCEVKFGAWDSVIYDPKGAVIIPSHAACELGFEVSPELGARAAYDGGHEARVKAMFEPFPKVSAKANFSFFIGQVVQSLLKTSIVTLLAWWLRLLYPSLEQRSGANKTTRLHDDMNTFSGMREDFGDSGVTEANLVKAADTQGARTWFIRELES